MVAIGLVGFLVVQDDKVVVRFGTVVVVVGFLVVHDDMVVEVVTGLDVGLAATEDGFFLDGVQ